MIAINIKGLEKSEKYNRKSLFSFDSRTCFGIGGYAFV